MMAASAMSPIPMANPPKDMRSAASPIRLHDDEGEEDGEGEGEHGEEGRREVPHEEEEDPDDQDHTQAQVGGDGPEAGLDEGSLVVERNDLDPLGEAGVHRFDLLFQTVDDVGRIGPEELQDQPHHLLTLGVGQGGPSLDGRAAAPPGPRWRDRRGSPPGGPPRCS